MCNVQCGVKHEHFTKIPIIHQTRYFWQESRGKRIIRCTYKGHTMYSHVIRCTVQMRVIRCTVQMRVIRCTYNFRQPYSCVGLARNIYIRCIYGISGRKITIYKYIRSCTVYIYGSGQPYESYTVFCLRHDVGKTSCFTQARKLSSTLPYKHVHLKHGRLCCEARFTVQGSQCRVHSAGFTVL